MTLQGITNMQFTTPTKIEVLHSVGTNERTSILWG